MLRVLAVYSHVFKRSHYWLFASFNNSTLGEDPHYVVKALSLYVRVWSCLCVYNYLGHVRSYGPCVYFELNVINIPI